MLRKPDHMTTTDVGAAVASAAPTAVRFIVSQYRGHAGFQKIAFDARETPGTPAAEIVRQAAAALFMQSIARPAMVYAVHADGSTTFCGNVTPPRP